MKFVMVGNFDVDYTSETHHANTLEQLGHSVVRLREAKTPAERIYQLATESDGLIWIHTHSWHTQGAAEVLQRLKAKGIPTLTYHLDLWLGLARQKDLDNDPFYKHIGWFFTVDKLMADWFNENTEVKGRYLMAGVYEPECYIDNSTGNRRKVIFVGSKGYHPEWPYRAKLIEYLEACYYGNFTHVGGDGTMATTRGAALNKLYARTKVTVGDSLNIGFKYPYYSSDRFFESMGRGAFLIYPKIKGFAEDFIDKQHVVYYEHGNLADLREKIDYYLEHDEEREQIRWAGHLLVKEKHTYTNRWQTILKEVFNV